MKNKELISKMTLEEKALLTSGKTFFDSQDIPAHDIPSICFSDGPHGVRKQQEEFGDHLGLNPSIPATCFPTAVTVASSWDLEMAEKLGQLLGEESRILGVNVLLGPGLNIKRNPRCGRNFEYFSEDPYLSGKMAAAYVRGIQSEGVGACLKHFACNNQEEKRMTIDSIVDERTMREIYLTGFEIAIKESNPKVIMSSYNLLNGTHTNENMHLLKDILRNEWKYEGMVVTDWGGENDRILGLEAYNALEMPNCKDTVKEVEEAVLTGKLASTVLDKNIDQIITLAHETRLKKSDVEEVIDVEKNHQLAMEIAQESMVLLKNHRNILPLKNNTKVAIIGDFAKNVRFQGAGSSQVNPTKLESTLDVIKDYQELDFIGYEQGFTRYGKRNKKLFKKAMELAKKADVILFYCGLDEVTEAEGLDRANINFPTNQKELAYALAHAGHQVVTIIHCGSPVKLSWADEAEAILLSYLGGQAGARATLNILTGRSNPCGKLAESFPYKYHDTSSKNYFPGSEKTAEYREGIYVGYRYYETDAVEVKYPFGYGLSYSKFEYSDLVVTSKGVDFKISNISEIDGKEIVQLYVGGINTKIFRPLKELKGFKKVFIKGHSSVDVHIDFDEYTFRYFNIKTNKFEIEEALYNIYVGASSNDIRLCSSLEVKGTLAPNPYNKMLIPSYYRGRVDNVSDEEFRILLGHEIPKATHDFLKKNRIKVSYNTTINDLQYARGWSGRFFSFVIRKSIKFLKMTGKTAKANEMIMGVLHQPMRGIARMTNGLITWSELNGLITMFNGHFFKGLSAFLKAKKEAKKNEKLLKKNNKL